MYRRTDALGVIGAIQATMGSVGISHPNKLEANGHTVLVTKTA